MAAGNFDRSLALVLVHEGGYSNHPADPGGATMKGVTQRVYDGWRARQGRPAQSVRNITDQEIGAIYRAQYWNVSRCDQLPDGLDYAVFDFAVNSGPGRAAKFLQRIVGVAQDGQIGEVTLAAVRERDASQIIAALCDSRLAWLRTLRTFSTFGRGWTRRVTDVRQTALGMAGDVPFAPPQSFANVMGKAGGDEKASSTIGGMLTNPASLTALSGAVVAAAPLATGGGPIQWALAAAVVVLVGVGAFYMVRKIRREA